MFCEVQPYTYFTSARADTHLKIEVDRPAAILIADALEALSGPDNTAMARDLAFTIRTAGDRWFSKEQVHAVRPETD